MRRPLLATGKLVENYEPLFAYYELARAAGLPQSSYTLTAEDFDELGRLVGAGRGLHELVPALAERFRARLDCSLASEAYRRSLGIQLGAEGACAELAKLYALWLVEASETLGMLSIKELYRRS
ncbi:MAG: hypothetical protein ABWK00_00495 [Desulfurococcaceae archaeon]